MNSYELIMFYYDKAEHYPISDRFIEKYQQRKNGYLDFAKKTGHLISANCHEPNQKWHLFESWFLQTVEEKKTDDLKEIKCEGFKCPELLLWMAEAAEVKNELIIEAESYAKEKIDEVRNNNPEAAYSSEAVKYMNKKFNEKYNETLWSMIIGRIKETINNA